MNRGSYTTSRDTILEKRLSPFLKQLKLAAVLLISLPAIDGWAQESNSGIRRPTLIACQQPVWDREALRYELEGTTFLQYDVDDGGRPSSVQVKRSSGWRILDQMAILAMKSCRFEPSSDPQVLRSGLQQSFDWSLSANDESPVNANLIFGSCQPSRHFGGFLAFNGRVRPRNDAILVRFLLDEEGNAFGIEVEETHAAPVREATDYIKSCRFSPATLNGKATRGNLFGWITLKSLN